MTYSTNQGGRWIRIVHGEIRKTDDITKMLSEKVLTREIFPRTVTSTREYFPHIGAVKSGFKRHHFPNRLRRRLADDSSRNTGTCKGAMNMMRKLVAVSALMIALSSSVMAAGMGGGGGGGFGGGASRGPMGSGAAGFGGAGMGSTGYAGHASVMEQGALGSGGAGPGNMTQGTPGRGDGASTSMRQKDRGQGASHRGTTNSGRAQGMTQQGSWTLGGLGN